MGGAEFATGIGFCLIMEGITHHRRTTHPSQGGDMDEDVVAAGVGLDEAETFVVDPSNQFSSFYLHKGGVAKVGIDP